jgi:hypothetical protein
MLFYLCYGVSLYISLLITYSIVPKYFNEGRLNRFTASTITIVAWFVTVYILALEIIKIHEITFGRYSGAIKIY